MARKTEYLGALEAAILISHKCTPIHRGSVFVQETANRSEVVWEGLVEVFDVEGHEKAKRCYAWQSINHQGGVTILTVLENQFVDSPKRAVQAAIFTDAQPITSSISLDLLKKSLKEAQQLLHEIQIKTEDLDAAIQASDFGAKARANSKLRNNSK